MEEKNKENYRGKDGLCTASDYLQKSCRFFRRSPFFDSVCSFNNNKFNKCESLEAKEDKLASKNSNRNELKGGMLT